MSPEWEAGYATNKVDGTGVGHLYHMLTLFTPGDQERVLELGCGLGANIAYWLERRSNYWGIEGSPTAVAAVRRAYPCLAKQVACGDFTKGVPFPSDFDVVFERASIAHNPLDSIRRCLRIVLEALKPGGIFVAVDWFSVGHSELSRGTVVDEHTRTDYPDGQFAGAGAVHFSSEVEIIDLFSDFEGVFIQERVTRRPVADGKFIKGVNPFRWQSRAFDAGEYASAVWDIVARRPR